MSRRVAPFKLLVVTAGKVDASMYETLARDHVKNPDEALVEIYRKLRPGDPPTWSRPAPLFRGMFMDPRRYDLARVRPLHDQREASASTRRPTPRCCAARTSSR